MLGVPVAGAGLVWQHAGRPAAAVGLAAAAVVGVLVVPPLLLVVAAFPGVLPSLLVSKRTRQWWRGYGQSKPPSWLTWRRKDPHGRKKPPARLRRKVLAADRKRCLWCGRKAGAGVVLQLDHWVAFAAGGLNWVLNFFTLCRDCNMMKSNYNVEDDGYVHYRPWGAAYNDRSAAARILAAESRQRWNLLRLWRAAFAW
jgi:5-methylcytosine-specific restriction endonuclease McrA